MLKKYFGNSVFVKEFRATSFLLLFLIGFSQSAQALTAEEVIKIMSVDERQAYISGIVGGLAFSRYLRDKPNVDGMNCVYDWHYRNEDPEKKSNRIYEWLSRNPDKPVEALLHILKKKECGE